MGSVRVRSVDRVAPPPHRRSYPAPGNTVPLSFFDTYWITLPPIQRLFLYPETNSLPFSSIVQSLKSSLSQALLKFHPLAGKLTHLPSSADVIIDCGTDDAGVEFVVAECDDEIRPLAGDQIHDSKAFIALVPELDTRALPMAVMAVQVTEFVNGGGVTLGLSLHHNVACIARARAAAADVTTNLVFLADCRSRLRPPLPDSYTGNCVSPCYASATCAELLGPTGLSRAWAEVARATREGTRDPLAGCETWAEDFMRVPESDRVAVSGSPRFPVYETDFGWGKPGRVELVSMNKDGEVVLVGGRDPGSVLVSVALDPVRIGLFAEVFTDGLEV